VTAYSVVTEWNWQLGHLSANEEPMRSIDCVYTGSANFREEQPCTNRRHPDFALHPFKINSSSFADN